VNASDWQRRFADLAARRTHEAAVPLPEIRTILDRGAALRLDALDDAWTRASFGGPFYQAPSDAALSAGVVFVRSREGNTGAKNPAALGGGPVDEYLIYEGLTRVATDAVAVGAGTLFRDSFFTVWRRELVDLRMRLGRPRHPAQIVLSADGSVNPEQVLLFNLPDVPVFVVTSDAGRSRLAGVLETRPWVTVVTGRSLQDQFATIEAAGVRRVVSVGGRRSASELVDAGFVRDAYLTTTQSSAADPGTPWYTGKNQPVMETALVKEWDGPDGVVRFEHAVLATST
jgi:riboflavin biosynthesis pyrimidine reductase